MNDEKGDGDGFDGIDELLDAVELVPTVGPVIRYLIERLPMVQAAQIRRMLDRLLDALAESERQFLVRVHADARLQRLVSDAAHAAARADSEGKLIALARLVQHGMRDEATLDEARFVIAIVDELQVIHVRALEALDAVIGQPGDGALEIAPTLNVSEPVGAAIASHLVRLALAETAGMSTSRLPSGLRISALGADVLALLHEVPVNPLRDSPRAGAGGDVGVRPPWWRAVHSEQFRIQQRLHPGDEATARALLSDAGFTVWSTTAVDDNTVEFVIGAPCYYAGPPVYGAVQATLLSGGVGSELAAAGGGHRRHQLAYHRWLTLRQDGEVLVHDGYPRIVLDGPDVDLDRVLDRYASWLRCDRSALTATAD